MKSAYPGRPRDGRAAILLLSLGVYVVWVLATYLLEGRVNLLQRVDPIGRTLYAVIANILIGIGLSTWLFRVGLQEGVVDARDLEFRSVGRSLIAIAAGAVAARRIIGPAHR